MNKMPDYIDDVIELLYPSQCITCRKRLSAQEVYLCAKCWTDLPVGRFQSEPENKVAQLFWGRVNTEHAVSWFHYRKGSRYQNLIHYIKYKGLKELGQEAGNRFGRELAESGLYSDISILVPVPLHIMKQKKRGYNQSEWIASGMALALQIPVVSNNLFRQIFTPTQTRKNRFERWQNVDGIFGVKNPDEFEGRHILLVDDVVTTGSTLEACAWELLKIKNVKVSIATLAFADL